MTTPGSNSLQQAIFACEVQVWQALVDGDAGADAAALCDSFLGVYADGFAGKADHVAQLADGPTVAGFTLADVQVRALGADHAMISYRADFTRIGKKPEAMFVTSVWERRGAGWINIFSQDTGA